MHRPGGLGWKVGPGRRESAQIQKKRMLQLDQDKDQDHHVFMYFASLLESLHSEKHLFASDPLPAVRQEDQEWQEERGYSSWCSAQSVSRSNSKRLGTARWRKT